MTHNPDNKDNTYCPFFVLYYADVNQTSNVQGEVIHFFTRQISLTHCFVGLDDDRVD